MYQSQNVLQMKSYSLVAGVAEVEALQVGGDAAHGLLELAEDPLVRHRQPARVGQALRLEILQVHQHEAAGVPDLVGEVAERFDLLLRHADVAAGRDAHHQREPQRIRAVLVDDLDRVDAVAERLAHLSTLRVAHEAVHQRDRERALAHLLDAGEHHARQPEEDDVVAAGEYRIRVEVLQIVRLLGQPSVLNGHSAEENHVSSTSSS